MTYTMGLALEDFMPVLLSSIGLYFVSRMVALTDAQTGRMAEAGWVLVSIGGLLKAVWKLVMAVTNTQTNLVWLDKGMFLWMASGFVLLAFAVWFGVEELMGKARIQHIWLGPGVALALTAVAILFTGFPDLQINTWRYLLLSVTTLGNVAFIVLLIFQARRLGQNVAAVLFAANIILVFVLNGMARMPEQTIPLQWAEQILNTVAQGAFVVAAWQVVKIVAQRPAAVKARRA